MACEPEDVISGAETLCCIPTALHAPIQSYLLARIRGGSMDVDEIMHDTACQFACIPPGLLSRIRTYLLCQLSNTGGGEIPVVTCTPDSDAQAFITAAGLTDQTQINAICQLVLDLKAYPAVGTKYWDREFLIYPFVGGNATAHSKNLKAPLGANNITWLGAAPPTHNAFGVKGNAATGYGNTSYLVPGANLDNIRATWYIYEQPATINRSIFGAANTAPASGAPGNLEDATHAFRYFVHDNTQSIILKNRRLGIHFIQRREAANKQYAQASDAWTNTAVASISVANRYWYLFAGDNAGGSPTGTASNFSDIGLSSLTLGTVLDAVGVSQVEKDEYKGIWDRFHTRLGRGYP